jgi:hypothetical protein
VYQDNGKIILARTTRKHGRFVEDLMMRYFEQKVCKFSVMVLETNSKTIERLIPTTGEVPKPRDFFYIRCQIVVTLLLGMLSHQSGAPGGGS